MGFGPVISGRQRITLIGAGLAGSLLALLLARRGFAVEVFERRADPRIAGHVGGRSINLALAERGMHALRLAGMESEVLAQAVMMRGRMVHEPGGNTFLQRYGRDDSEVIWSINRGRLNTTLLAAAEAAGARIHFDQELLEVDLDRMQLRLQDQARDRENTHDAPVIIGTDGAGSALRRSMGALAPLGEAFEPLGHGYKELEIPPAEGGGFSLEPNALHIWPRGGYMCIALPNADGSFTVTLFLPNEGPHPSFATLATTRDARALYESEFADALALIPDFENDFSANPTGMLGTLWLDRWHLDRRALLLGDAAHAIVPFHGQGMNCAFEDCTELDALLARGAAPADVFAEFEQSRRPNARAIARMALENYVEMRDRVDDPRFLLHKQLERQLSDRHPERFVPRYAMVTFRRTPYAVAEERGAIQAAILEELTGNASDVASVDLTRADQLIRDRLTPLDPA